MRDIHSNKILIIAEDKIGCILQATNMSNNKEEVEVVYYIKKNRDSIITKVKEDDYRYYIVIGEGYATENILRRLRSFAEYPDDVLGIDIRESPENTYLYLPESIGDALKVESFLYRVKRTKRGLPKIRHHIEGDYVMGYGNVTDDGFVNCVDETNKAYKTMRTVMKVGRTLLDIIPEEKERYTKLLAELLIAERNRIPMNNVYDNVVYGFLTRGFGFELLSNEDSVKDNFFKQYRELILSLSKR